MAKIIVGMGDWAVSANPADEIKTYALGSCVALIILDPRTRIAGLAHIVLPESRTDPAKARELPTYFADTGVPHLFRRMSSAGSVPSHDYIVKLAGGANTLSEHGTDRFEIGKRNVTAVKKILWSMNYALTSEDTGKNISRTVTVYMSNGRVVISGSDGTLWEV